MQPKHSWAGCSTALAGLLCLSFTLSAAAESTITGRVVDLNGAPLAQAMVSLDAAESHAGADVITVFTDEQGQFVFSESVSGVDSLSVRMLDYEELDQVGLRADGTSDVTIVMRPRTNQADVAPASAWLGGMNDPEEKAHLVLDCIGCHQVPSPQARNYAKLIAAVEDADPAEVRRQSWQSMITYMNYLSDWEFGRANPTGPPGPERAYSVSGGDVTANSIADHFVGPMDQLSGYDYGAPSIVNENTVIREYEVSGANAIREAVLIGEELWIADVSSNRMVVIDVATGEQRHLEVPAERTMGPHTLHRGSDGTLWVAPFFDSVVAHWDPAGETWETWSTTTINGESVGIHDLSFGSDHELLTDNEGLVWYSDIVNGAVGYLDPDTGDAEIYYVPDVPGREDNRATVYGLVMTSDRKEIWYSQMGRGAFGSFDIETREFGDLVELPSIDAGPRRLTISDDDILYAPLYGAGQLVEYDTRSRELIGTYDLPDTGSAPYAATWDPVREVVWIPTSNGDVIYRFDPRTKAIGVLPLPRDSAFLRMVDVDPETGVLITSYANIVQFVHGPRMALIIDPGDGAYADVAVGAQR